MPITLEVKKFINSEYTGYYAEIMLPCAIEPEQEKSPAEAEEGRGKKNKKTHAERRAEKKARKKQEEYDDDYYDDEDEEEPSKAAAAQTEKEEVTVEEPEKTEEPEEKTEPAQAPETEAAEEKSGEPVPPVQAEQKFEKAKIHYLEAGIGEPIILLHTIGQSAYTWRNMFEKLSEHYRVIAVDLLGHGYSSRPENFEYTIADQAMALGKFMDALELEKAGIVAFSMGCAYALEFALNNPQRVSRLVLLAPGGLVPEMPMSIRLIDSSLFGTLACLLYTSRTVNSILEQCFFDLTNLNMGIVNDYYTTIADGKSRRAIRMSLHNYDDNQLLSKLRMMETQILILQGSEDKWRTTKEMDMLHASMPQSVSSVIRNAGHLIHEEKPDKVVYAILEFIPVKQRG